MVEFCRAKVAFKWLTNVIVALACTGLRIAELASLRWSDLDLNTGRLKLTDETGRPVTPDRKRRKLKSGRSRTFPIHADLLIVLQDLPRRGGSWSAKSSIRWSRSSRRQMARRDFAMAGSIVFAMRLAQTVPITACPSGYY